MQGAPTVNVCIVANYEDIPNMPVAPVVFIRGADSNGVLNLL
jgi:hypothetical protein